MTDESTQDWSDEQQARTSFVGDRERRTRWLGEAERLVAEVFGEDRVARVKEQAGRAPEAGDAVFAAWIDDVRLIEQARFHRARRDLGREVALGRKAAAVAATDRMNRAADTLGILRVQRDAVTGKEPLRTGHGGGAEPDQPDGQHGNQPDEKRH